MNLRTNTENRNLVSDNSMSGSSMSNKRMDRRVFFKKLCALSGALVIPVSLIPAGCSQDGGTGTDTASLPDTDSPVIASTAFSKQVFEDNIDTVFSVTHESYGVVDLQLNLVSAEKYIPEAEQFSISLSGPESLFLSEGSYAVYNDNLGNIDLYIQPGSNSNGLQHYVAVFSLLNA